MADEVCGPDSRPSVRLTRLRSRSSECLLDIDNDVSVSQKMNLYDDTQNLKRPDLLGVETNLTRRVLSEGDLLSPKNPWESSVDDRTVSYGGGKLLDAIKKDPPKMRRVTDSNLLGGRRPEDMFKTLQEQGHQSHQTGGISSWLFGSSAGATSTTNSTTTTPPQLVPVTIQQEPRRLFGFGPTFQPPSETMMVPAGGDGPLLQKIKKEGRESTTLAPTQAEMNTFAPFSM